jgi:hypothetical protein
MATNFEVPRYDSNMANPLNGLDSTRFRLVSICPTSNSSMESSRVSGCLGERDSAEANTGRVHLRVRLPCACRAPCEHSEIFEIFVSARRVRYAPP